MPNDGYIRLPFTEVKKLFLIHLISGVDQDVPTITSHGAVPTAITGYTEWVSNSAPAITIGWDWQMHALDHCVQLKSLSEPRSNLMLQSVNFSDVGHLKTATLLEAFIDGLSWESEVLKYINAH